MKTDVNMFMLSIVNTMNEAVQKANVDELNRGLELIKKYNISDLDFQDYLNKCEKWKKDKINSITTKVDSAIKTIIDAKTVDELYFDVEEIEDDLKQLFSIKAVNAIELEYWSNLLNYFIEHFNKVPEEKDDD